MTDEFIVQEVSWASHHSELQEVRQKVFVFEQRVDQEIEIDGRDPECYHVLVKTSFGEPIGTGRLTPEGKIGRVSVLMNFRNKGIGSKILHELIQIAEREKLEAVKLHAQIHAVEFYERHQFVANGPVFMEAGIPHQSMKRFRAN
ncbi:MAG: GNAT family N-acetyltransferase [Gammaproteobacteria bacterium]|nr:GNAT family N-acetyltransferase [Gammaproteobacteria bacterium]